MSDPPLRGRSANRWPESHRHAIHTITQMRRWWAVIEDMAEMSAATVAMHFGAHHAER